MANFLVRVGGVTLPEPSTYSPVEADIPAWDCILSYRQKERWALTGRTDLG